MNYEMIESNYESGLLPERYYNQLNNKSPQENYRRRKAKYDKRRSFLENLITNMLRASLEATLKELLEGFIITK